MWTSWVWGYEKFDFKESFRENINPYPYKIGNILEIPMVGDYAFNVKKENIDRFVNLGLKEFNTCWEKGYPFILVSHWHGLERNGSTGYKVHKKLIPEIIKSGKAEIMTISQLYKKYQKENK